ncbi:hypothetical protein [Lyngbya sp. CCY1209]|uniref:hypothetical protein n=1 Tax=Lyngbya sp. CCY1209 TaxID=2886103 RepID=UPI002D210434|nr:hypothetical protein [Lyngbya sp. CCY1209]MEB3883986.1 hypothetical protein [Lyngbya sp. CCY1209]
MAESAIATVRFQFHSTGDDTCLNLNHQSRIWQPDRPGYFSIRKMARLSGIVEVTERRSEGLHS